MKGIFDRFHIKPQNAYPLNKKDLALIYIKKEILFGKGLQIQWFPSTRYEPNKNGFDMKKEERSQRKNEKTLERQKCEIRNKIVKSYFTKFVVGQNRNKTIQIKVTTCPRRTSTQSLGI